MLDPRLVRAEILKLRRRRGLMAWTALLTFGAVALSFGFSALMHAVGDPQQWRAAGGGEGLELALALLAMTGAVAGVLIGATAGGADIEAGVFRDLAATGRSRTALFAARVPGAWAILVPATLAGIAIAALLASALAGDGAVAASAVLEGGAAALASTMLLSAASAGLAALASSRGMVIGVVLAFQLGLSPVLAQIGALGDVRYAIPSVATARIGGELADEVALAVAILVVLGWAAVTLGAGLWRTRTQEI
jgi:ABC-type transport system involved in multi-copper enzyme maturation permease subunit